MDKVTNARTARLDSAQRTAMFSYWGEDVVKIRVVTITVKYRSLRNDPLHWTCLAPFGGRLKDGYKYKKSKVKKVKRTIPAWASVAASKKLPVTNFSGTQNKVDDVLIEAITVCTNCSSICQTDRSLCCANQTFISRPVSLQSCNDKSGVSYQSVMKYIVKKYPGMDLDRKKFLIKKSMKKHLEKGTIKQVHINICRNDSVVSFTFAVLSLFTLCHRPVKKIYCMCLLVILFLCGIADG